MSNKLLVLLVGRHTASMDARFSTIDKLHTDHTAANKANKQSYVGFCQNDEGLLRGRMSFSKKRRRCLKKIDLSYRRVIERKVGEHPALLSP